MDILTLRFPTIVFWLSVNVNTGRTCTPFTSDHVETDNCSNFPATMQKRAVSLKNPRGKEASSVGVIITAPRRRWTPGDILVGTDRVPHHVIKKRIHRCLAL